MMILVHEIYQLYAMNNDQVRIMGNQRPKDQTNALDQSISVHESSGIITMNQTWMPGMMIG